jgi:hypothetical protein
LTRPELVAAGTVVERDVVVDPERANVGVRLTFSRLFWSAESKFVPAMVRAVPIVAIADDKLAMVGAFALATVKAVALLADPDGLVTAIVPVVAETGTVTVSFDAVAADTIAEAPLNVTVLLAGVGLNPTPEIVTVVPVGPESGVNSIIDTVPDELRAIESRLPVASYE